MSRKRLSFHILSLFSGLNKRSATPMQLLARSRWFLLYALFQHPHLVQYLKWRWEYLSLVVLPSPVITRRWNEYLFNDWFILCTYVVSIETFSLSTAQFENNSCSYYIWYFLFIIPTFYRAWWRISLYDINNSVLVESRPLVKFTRNYIWDSSGVFSISSLVRISITSFSALTLFHSLTLVQK